MKLFWVIIILVAIGTGWLCAQTSNVIDQFTLNYTQEESKIDKLINIFQDWKDKDTKEKK